MKAMKRTMVTLLALLPFATGTALADDEDGYSRIFVFGDSFSDPGNHFAVTGETAHPPFDPVPLASYGVGGHHFTNGRTWVEVLAQEMGLTEWAKPAYREPANDGDDDANVPAGNYAYAYARARPYSPVGPSFGEQVEDWIDDGHCLVVPMYATLFVVQIGGNDLSDALDAVLAGQDPTSIFEGAIGSIAANIGTLAACGAHNFLVANLPNLAASPLVPPEYKDGVTAMTMQFNETLQGVLDAYFGGLNMSTVDFFLFGTVAMETPEVYGFSNVTDTCLTFGVTKNAFCKDRDGYFFWDPLHPTKKAHALLGEIALGQLPALD